MTLSGHAAMKEIVAEEGSELVVLDFERKDSKVMPRFSINGLIYKAEDLPERYHAVSYSEGEMAGYQGLRIMPVQLSEEGTQIYFLPPEQATLHDAHASVVINVNTKLPLSDEGNLFFARANQLLSFLRAQSNNVIQKAALPADFSFLHIDEIIYFNAITSEHNLSLPPCEDGEKKLIRRLVIVDDTHGHEVFRRPYKVAKNEEVIFVGLHDSKESPVDVVISNRETVKSMEIDCSEGQCHFYNLRFRLAPENQKSVPRRLIKNMSGAGMNYDVWSGVTGQAFPPIQELNTNIIVMNSLLVTTSLDQVSAVLMTEKPDVEVVSGLLWRLARGFNSLISSNISGLSFHSKLLVFSSLLPVIGASVNHTNTTVSVGSSTVGAIYALGGIAVLANIFNVYMMTDYVFYTHGYQRFSMWRQVKRCFDCCCHHKVVKKNGIYELGRMTSGNLEEQHKNQ